MAQDIGSQYISQQILHQNVEKCPAPKSHYWTEIPSLNRGESWKTNRLQNGRIQDR